jgi:hypothetical protein
MRAAVLRVGQLDPSLLPTATYPLASIVEAFTQSDAEHQPKLQLRP